MRRAFILFGSNIAPFENLSRALTELKASFDVVAVSPPFLTAPVGDTEQEDFINVAIEVRTDWEPGTIHQRLREIERCLGRRRDPARRFGPRSVDLDLVLIEGVAGSFGELKLPSPLLEGEAFVAVPLAALAPEVVPPGLKSNLATIAERTIAHCARPPRLATEVTP